MTNQQPLLVIVGPTASGKSDLAMQVAKRYHGELICADSRTIYKGMDVGTAKPSRQDQLAVPHHLLDVVSPNQKFTAADFKRLALKAIDDISLRGYLPIVVGGTGLYIDSILFDYQFGSPADSIRRAELEAMNIEELQKYCRYNNIKLPINDKNKRHLIRAIELGGLPKVNWQLRSNTLVVGITTDNEILKQRIQQRVEKMFTNNVMEETKQLAQQYGWNNEAMTSNVYRIIRGVMGQEYGLSEAQEKTASSDLALTKRQLTWFKRNPFIIWGTSNQLLQEIDSWYNNKRGE